MNKTVSRYLASKQAAFEDVAKSNVAFVEGVEEALHRANYRLIGGRKFAFACKGMGITQYEAGKSKPITTFQKSIR